MATSSREGPNGTAFSGAASTPNFPAIAPTGSTPSNIPVVPNASDLSFTDAQVDGFREQDRWLPIANVARIMKNSLPVTAKVSKEAKECVQECVSEFISFITSEAAEKCFNEKRKTINGEDILTSMKALGFDNYEGVLNVFLAKYREHQLIQGRQRQFLGEDVIRQELGTKRSVEEESADSDGKKKKAKTTGGRGKGKKAGEEESSAI